MLYDLISIIAALAILIKSSDYFVDASARIARAFGVSEFVIGVTLVAVGTSIPEFASSIAASFYQNSQLVTGPIIGANIARIGIVLGICAVIAPVIIEKRVFTKEGIYLLFISLVFGAFAIDRNIGRIEGIILLFLFAVYMLWLLETDVLKGSLRRFFANAGKKGISYGFKALREEIRNNGYNPDKTQPKATWKFIAAQSAIIIASGAALFFAGKYIIPSLENVALAMKIPDTVAGLLVLGIGTTLPELMVCISAAKKGMGNMIMGTIIGSNIADTLLVIGVSSLIHPISVSLMGIAYYLPAMILFTILLLIFIRTGWVVRMFEGFIFLLLYAIFLALLFYFIKMGILAGAPAA